jgi:[acyl-carrier-protein] S-malonyltransferase
MKTQKAAFLFPGQGAHYQGMALDLFDESGAVRNLFTLASEVMGQDMRAVISESGADTLKGSEVAQPAITLANLAAAFFLRERGFTPLACAGVSLGEYAAFACAGIISVEDCFALVTARGKAMQSAVDSMCAADNDSTPGMAVVTGLAPERVESVIADWTADAGVKNVPYAANFNSKRQVVISGTAAVLAEAESRFKKAGARRVLRLQVAGPYHCPLMAGAAEAFKPALNAVTFNDGDIPLYSNVTGERIKNGAEVKELALRHITSPVRWTAVEAALAGDVAAFGVEAVLEAGPGTTLCGLWNEIESGIPVYCAGTLKDIDTLLGLSK